MNTFANIKRLRALADGIENNDISNADRAFLVNALRSIADGNDPKLALNINGRRGYSTSPKAQALKAQSQINKTLALAWLAAAVEPTTNDGLGLTLKAAIEIIGKNKTFGFTQQTLKTYCRDHPELRKLQFELED